MISWILTLLVLAVPIAMWPKVGTTVNHPKSLVIVVGMSLATFIYLWKPLRLKLDEITNWLVLVLIALNVASFFYTTNPYYTKQAVILNLSCLSAFYLTALYGNTRRIFKAFVIAGVIVSVVAIAQYFWEPYLPHWIAFKSKIASTIGNSNYVACFLMFPVFACIGLLRERKHVWLLSIAMAIFALAFLCIRIRAGLLGIGVGSLVLAWLWRYKINWKRTLLWSVALLGILPLLWLPPIKAKIKPHEWFRSKSMVQRMKYWRASWELFQNSPIIGHGLWSYRKMVYGAQSRIQQRDPSYFTNYKKAQPRRAHNDYLELLNDGGIVLFIACGAFLFWVFRRRIRGDPLRDAAFGAFIAVLVSAIFFFPFRVNTTMFASAIMLGALRGTNRANHHTLLGPVRL